MFIEKVISWFQLTWQIAHVRKEIKSLPPLTQEEIENWAKEVICTQFTPVSLPEKTYLRAEPCVSYVVAFRFPADDYYFLRTGLFESLELQIERYLLCMKFIISLPKDSKVYTIFSKRLPYLDRPLSERFD